MNSISLMKQFVPKVINWTIYHDNIFNFLIFELIFHNFIAFTINILILQLILYKIFPFNLFY
jgi:hypothetical protein